MHNVKYSIIFLFIFLFQGIVFCPVFAQEDSAQSKVSGLEEKELTILWLTEKRDALAESLQESNIKRDALASELQELKATLQKVQRDASKQIDDATSSLKKKIKSNERQLEKKENIIVQLKKELKILDKKFSDSQKQEQDYQKQITNLRTELKGVEQSLAKERVAVSNSIEGAEKVEIQLKDEKSRRNALVGEMSALRSKLKQVQSSISGKIKEEKNPLIEKITMLEKQLKVERDAIEKHVKEKADLNKVIDTYKSQQLQFEKQLAVSAKELKDIQMEFSTIAKRTRDSMNQEIAETNKMLARSRSDIAEKESLIVNLQKKNQAFIDQRNYANSEKKLLNQELEQVKARLLVAQQSHQERIQQIAKPFKKEIQLLEKLVAAKEKELDQKERSFDELSDKTQWLKEELNTLTAEKLSLESELNTFTKEMADIDAVLEKRIGLAVMPLEAQISQSNDRLQVTELALKEAQRELGHLVIEKQDLIEELSRSEAERAILLNQITHLKDQLEKLRMEKSALLSK